MNISNRVAAANMIDDYDNGKEYDYCPYSAASICQGQILNFSV
jgi:hypothetical protein